MYAVQLLLDKKTARVTRDAIILYLQNLHPTSDQEDAAWDIIAQISNALNRVRNRS